MICHYCKNNRNRGLHWGLEQAHLNVTIMRNRLANKTSSREALNKLFHQEIFRINDVFVVHTSNLLQLLPRALHLRRFLKIGQPPLW